MKIIRTLLLSLFLVYPLSAKLIRDDAKQTVYDTVTNVVWQDDSSVVTSNLLSWQEAIDYCQTLNFADATNWELPDQNMLLTIRDPSGYSPSIYPEFSNTSSSPYWSATTSAVAASQARVIDFYDHYDYDQDKLYTAGVRCMHIRTPEVTQSSDSFEISLEKTLARVRGYIKSLVNYEFNSQKYKEKIREIRHSLISDVSVASVEFIADDNGLLVTYKDGYCSYIYHAPEGNKSAPSLLKRDKNLDTKLALLKQGLRSNNNKVLAIAAQYWDWGYDDDVPQLAEMLRANGFDVTYKHYDYRQIGVMKDFTEWDDYAIVLLSTHGIASDVRKRDANAINMALDLNIKFTKANYNVYKEDIKNNLLVPWTNCNKQECHDSLLATDIFFKEKLKTLPNTLLYISACYIAKNDALAEVLFNKGASVMIGYNNLVQVSFAQEQGIDIFTRYIGDESISSIFNLPANSDLSKGYHTGIIESDTTPAEVVVFKKEIVEATEVNYKDILQSQTFAISGSFAPHDFEGVDDAFDWVFVTSNGATFQLQGKDATSSDVFGWKAVFGITNTSAAWYMFPLGDDFDGDGSEKFDWIFVGKNIKAVYKLDGMTESGTFKYSQKIEIDYIIDDNKVKFLKK